MAVAQVSAGRSPEAVAEGLLGRVTGLLTQVLEAMEPAHHIGFVIDDVKVRLRMPRIPNGGG